MAQGRLLAGHRPRRPLWRAGSPQAFPLLARQTSLARCAGETGANPWPRVFRQWPLIRPGPLRRSLRKMTDQFSILKLVTERLDALGIAYMLTGSIAAGYYAQPRMTRDIDLVVELEPTDAEGVVAAFTPEFNCDVDVIRDAIARQSLFNLIHVEAVAKVDFVVRKDIPYRREEFRRRRHVEIGGHPLWIVSPEDLILSKLTWAKTSRSEMQLRDVRQLLTSVPTLDQTYLDRWAADLTVTELLREVARD